MHVLHVIDSLAMGGAERMLVDIANATCADGHRVSVCVTRSDCRLADSLCREIDLWVLGRKRRLDFGALRQFGALVRKSDVDVLHVHGRSSFSFVAVARALRLFDKPVLLQDHRSVQRDMSVPKWFRYWGASRLDQYVGVYEGLRVWAHEAGIPPSRVSVIENSADLSRISEATPADIRQELGIDAETLLGIMVGGLRPDKGLEVLLRALNTTAHRGQMIVLVVGAERQPGYVAACRALAAELGLEQSVLFLGERRDASQLMRAADLALLPSVSESGPLVLIEFMACGLPFVASRVGGIAERVFALGVPGFVEPSDTRGFASAVDAVLSLSRDERERRGRENRAIALRHFNIQSVMKHWYLTYSSLCKV